MTLKTKNIIIYSSITLVVGVITFFVLRQFVKKTSVFVSVVSPKSILFVGDSITAGVGFSYSYLLKNQLTDKTVDVLAKSSMQTSWMLSNLMNQLATKKYDRVYIWGGVNDVFSGRTPESALANVQSMVDLVNVNGGKAFVIVGYDSEKFMANIASDKVAVKNKYIAYQNLLKTNIRNATIVDEFPLDATMTTDSIHPNANAHKIIAAILYKNII